MDSPVETSVETSVESSDLSYDPSSIIVSPITQPLSPPPTTIQTTTTTTESKKSPNQPNESDVLDKPNESDKSNGSFETDESDHPIYAQDSSMIRQATPTLPGYRLNEDAGEDDNSHIESTDETEVVSDREFYQKLGISGYVPTIPDIHSLSPTLTCSEKLDPERDGKTWLFSENKTETGSNYVNTPEATIGADNIQPDLNKKYFSNESDQAIATTMQLTSIPTNATNACNTTYKFNYTTSTTTATFVNSSQTGSCLTTVAGSAPASLTASAPLFNKNATYTFKALNCNASSSAVVSGVNNNVNTKRSSIPSGSLYLPAQATAGQMKLPNSTKSVPMVMVPVPDGRTLMAIPMSSLNNTDINQFTTQANQFNPTSLDFLKNNPQLKGLNPNLSGTLLTIQIPSSVSSNPIVASSNNTTVTNTTSITLTGSKSSATPFSKTVKAVSANLSEPQPATLTSTPTTTTNSTARDEVSTTRAQQRNSHPSHADLAMSLTGTSKPPIQTSDKPLLDEQAKKLLRWTKGPLGPVGTLDGCDFKFTLNEFGDLEVLDSDDEEENIEDISSQVEQNFNSLDLNKRRHEFCSNGMNERGKKKPRYEANSKSSCASRKVLPGSSLLSGGPDDKSRRAKPTTSIKSKSPQPPKGLTDANNTINMNWQHLIEKLMPEDRLGTFKMEDAYNWKPDVVKKFVDSIAGCAGNGCLFEFNQICGESLMLMNQRDLVDILNIKLGPAVKIHHAILLVKEQSGLEQAKKTTNVE